MMIDERLLIVIHAHSEDINPLVVCLKSLEIFPPVLDFSVCVTFPEECTNIQSLLEGIDKIRMVSYKHTIGQALNSILDSTQHKYIVIAHSDVVFKSPHWTDQVFSVMLQNDLAMLGTQPFYRYDLKEGGIIHIVGDWFKAYLREPLVRSGGFHGLIDLHGNNFVSQLRLRKHGFQVMAGNVNPFIDHLQCCKIDKTEISNHTIKELSTIFDQENLGEIQ